MYRVASAVLMAVFVATLAGCATNKQYVVSTKNGRMEIATSKPQAVPGTDLYMYLDQVGNMQTIRQSDFAMVIER